MQITTKISQFRKSLFIVMGLLVAAFVVTQEVCDYQCQLITAELIENQDEENPEQEEQLAFQVSNNDLLPTATVQIEPFMAVFIRELFVEADDNQPVISEISHEESQHFKTLFRQIQSPNAP